MLRARPLNSLELTKNGDETCITCDGDSVAVRVAKAEHAGTVRFAFDRVFGPSSTQKQVYDFIGPIAIHGMLAACVGSVGFMRWCSTDVSVFVVATRPLVQMC